MKPRRIRHRPRVGKLGGTLVGRGTGGVWRAADGPSGRAFGGRALPCAAEADRSLACAQTLAVFQPAMYIFIGTLSMVQFRNLYDLLKVAVTVPVGNEYLEVLQASGQRVYGQLEGLLGPPSKLTVNFTHILLAALLACLCLELAAVRSALAYRKK